MSTKNQNKAKIPKIKIKDENKACFKAKFAWFQRI